jgi:hypothetical protein
MKGATSVPNNIFQNGRSKTEMRYQQPDKLNNEELIDGLLFYCRRVRVDEEMRQLFIEFYNEVKRRFYRSDKNE